MNGLRNETSARSLAGRCIERDLANLAQASVDCQLNTHPEMRGQFVDARYQKCVQDTAHPLSALAQALLVEEPALFEGYVLWAMIVLANLGLPDEYLADSLIAIRETLVTRLADGPSEAAAEYIDLTLNVLKDASTALPSTTRANAPLADVASRYLEALLAGDRGAALEIARDAVAAGAALSDIYEHVFRVTQHEVGRMWQANRLSVAMEHYATGATQTIMSQLSVMRSRQAAAAHRFLGACVEGEQHDMAIRMVCDVLESDGPTP